MMVDPSNFRANSRHFGSDHIPSRMANGNIARTTHSQVLPKKSLKGRRGLGIAYEILRILSPMSKVTGHNGG
jgi:hypothetical protein